MTARNVLITDASAEPVTDQQVLTDLKEDSALMLQIKPYLVAARQSIEEELISLKTTQRTYELRLDDWNTALNCDGEIILPACPLVSITSIKYDDTSEVEQTLSAAAYQADTASMPGRIRWSGAVTLPAVFDKPNAVRIRYVAGYGAAAATDAGQSAVPYPLKAAIMLKTRLLREPGAFPDAEREMVNTIQRLIAPFRIPV